MKSNFDFRPSNVIQFLLTHIPVILVAFYLVFSWIAPIDWEPDNELDGSWRYALGKLRFLGLSLGKDAFFTYGPVAHWFGPPMGAERYQPLPYYLLGLAVIALLCLSLSYLLSKSTIPSAVKLAIVFAFPPFPVPSEVTLYLAVMFTVAAGYLLHEDRKWWIVVIMLLSGIGINYKFSFGIMSTFCFASAIAYAAVSRTVSRTWLCLIVGAYCSLTYGLFVLSSGSFDIITYLAMGEEISSRYSEVMIRDDGFFIVRTLLTLMYVLTSFALLWVAIRKMQKKSKFFFVITMLGIYFLLFKHGFVRADRGHILYYYYSTFPFIMVVALSVYSQFKNRSASQKSLLLASIALLVMVYGVMMNRYSDDYKITSLIRNWKSMGTGIAEGLRGQLPEKVEKKVAAVRSAHPDLFSNLDRRGVELAAKGTKPSITFYPWEVLLMEGVEGFALKPSPALQLYPTGPGSKAHRLEADFLSSEQRPDLVVVGPMAIDGRFPVSEMTDLLPSLHAGYRVAAIIGQHTVLESREPGTPTTAVVRHYLEPRGGANEMMLLKLDSSQLPNRFLWRLVTTLFKSPELSVAITWGNRQNQVNRATFRSSICQLEKGILFYPAGLPNFFRNTFKKTDTYVSPESTLNEVVAVTAELSRDGSAWNLPAVPEHLPLQVEFCSFQ